MNCEWVKTNAALYLYGELQDDARYELEQHLTKCPECAAEVQALRAFHGAMTAAAPVPEPSPNLVAASRMRLQEALEHAEQRTSPRWTLDLAQWFQQLKFSPALAAMLLMVGFAGGAVATFSARSTAGTGAIVTADATLGDAGAIGAVRAISQDPASNTVQIRYDRLVPEQKQGSMSDPQIQQLLLYAARNNFNSGVRLDSVDLLSSKQVTQDERIREALIFSLRYDKNPGVRLKALAGLKSYIRGDMRVRDAILEALLRDSNPGIRTEAIRSLGPVMADSSVRSTLRALAERDENQFIRSESRRVLATLPEIQ